MPDLESGKNRSYHFLNKISTEELKRILQEDFESEGSDDPENDVFITHVMEVIAERESGESSTPGFDIAAGWDDFQKNYRPEADAPILMCDDEKLAEFIQNNKSQVVSKAPQPKRAGHKFLRIAILAAVAMCICAVAASVLEINIVKMFARWTQDIFQFRSEQITSQGVTYLSGTMLNQDQTLQDALEEVGVTKPVSPKWIPDGFSYSGSKSFTEVAEPMFTALYEDETTDRTIIVSVNIHQAPISSIQEKDSSPVDLYQVDGVDYYIMQNNGVEVATWFIDNLECSIMGEISKAEMEMMINSIYEE